MTNLMLIFRYELVRNITRKGYLFATLGIPLLAIVAFVGYPIYQSMQTEDPEETSAALQELALENVETAGLVDYSGVFANPAERFTEVLIAYPDEESAREALVAEEIDVFLVFAEDYLESGDASLHMPNLNLGLLSEGESLGQQLAYSTFATGLDEIRLSRLRNPTIYTNFDLSINEEGSDSSTADGQFIFVYAFAMIFFISLILTNTYLMQTVIEERDNRMVEILISTVTPVQLLGGKILAMATLGLVQIVCWIAVSIGLFMVADNFETYDVVLEMLSLSLDPQLFVLMAVYFVLMYLIYAAIFGTIGALSGSSQEGSQYAGFIILPTIIPFYFFPILQTDPNGILGTVFSLIPFTAPVTIMARMVIATVPVWQLVLSVILLILTAAGAMWMAGRVFRVQTLLAGNTLKVSDLPRLIFARD
ncbi:MAG: ABC transporter permease [Anaerolineae bacterium]